MPVTLAVPLATLTEFQRIGRASKGSTTGDAMIDTGAGMTCVNPLSLQELGFDLSQPPPYVVDLRFNDTEFPIEPVNAHPHQRIFEEQPRLLAVIGRDVLKHYSLFCDGRTGFFSLAR